MKKTAKRYHLTATLVSLSIVLMAALIILLSILLPRLREKRIFTEQYEALLSADYTVFLLSDPLYKTGEAILDRGVEASLDEKEVLEIRAYLQSIKNSGFRNADNERRTEGAWDMRLQIRTADGARAMLYLAEHEFYFYAEGTVFPFKPQDAVAYEGLYHLLQSILKAHA